MTAISPPIRLVTMSQTERKEHGTTRQSILYLLRRYGQLTASELSEYLHIGAVGVRQHLTLLERDGLVEITGLRRSIGRPSYLYTLTPSAEQHFPKRMTTSCLAPSILSLTKSGYAASSSYLNAGALNSTIGWPHNYMTALEWPACKASSNYSMSRAIWPSTRPMQMAPARSANITAQ